MCPPGRVSFDAPTSNFRSPSRLAITSDKTTASWLGRLFGSARSRTEKLRFATWVLDSKLRFLEMDPRSMSLPVTNRDGLKIAKRKGFSAIPPPQPTCPLSEHPASRTESQTRRRRTLRTCNERSLVPTFGSPRQKSRLKRK